MHVTDGGDATVKQTFPGDKPAASSTVTTTATTKMPGHGITAPIVTAYGDRISAGQTVNFRFCHRYEGWKKPDAVAAEKQMNEAIASLRAAVIKLSARKRWRRRGRLRFRASPR